MELSYTLTTDDLRAYVEWGAARPAVKAVLDRTRYLGSAVFLAISAIFALAGSLEGGSVLMTMAVVLAATGVVAFFALGPRMRASYVKRSLGMLSAGKTAYLLGPRTARLSADGFALAGPGIAASYAWELVDRIEMSASGVYVFLGAQQAHVVPRSAFASFEEMKAFAHAAEEYAREGAVA